jgi:regulator of sirC expression with transglutaminase-like and TPR domain
MHTLTHPAEARRQFRELAGGEITHEAVARGALLIALEEYPQLDVGHYLALLDRLAERVQSRCSAGEPGIFRLGHLHAEMFDVDGYRGDSEDYYNVRNAFLNEVIDRRAGLPILLSIVFLYVASRIGLTASGVGLPGHYIVKVQFELNEVYVDPFQGGATLTAGDIAALVSQMGGGEVRLTSEHLRSWSGRQTLIRVLTNVQGMHMRRGDMKRAEAARERIDLLEGYGM